MSYLYVPGLGGSSSASSSQCPPLVSSATWRGKPMQPRSWRLAWKRGILTPLLSGLTSDPSTRERGVERWISSLRASRASRSPSLGSACTKTTNAISGPRLPESSRSAVQLSFSWRTTTPEPSESPTETYEQWASRCRRPSHVPPPSWVLDILGAGSSFLPTATKPYGSNKGGSAGRVGRTRYSMEHLLATATIKGDHNRKGASKKSGNGLSTQLGGTVNPDWKDWFMGLPIGWTDIAPLEKCASRRWLDSHSSPSSNKHCPKTEQEIQ